MSLTPCFPCDCIQGNIGNAKFKQDVEVILCQILTALGGGGVALLDAQSFVAPIPGAISGPFAGLSRVSMQVYALGGQPNDWSVELYGSFDGVHYGRILTHSLGINDDGGYSYTTVLGVNYLKPVVKILDLGSASSITVNIFGNSSS